VTDGSSYTVHKCFLEPDLILGVPRFVVIFLAAAAAFIYGLFGLKYIFLLILVYIPVRIVTKADPDMILILGDALFEPDFLEG
jgi:type IV secretory pathway VirB3-like protein